MKTNQVLHGDCTQVLQQLPSESVDFVLTDPPYFVRYRDRQGRTIANDIDPQSVLGAFSDVYRVLKANTFCVSFYGWNRADSFLRAWRSAGFTPVGHLVWHKNYASSSKFLRRCHEQAYLLAKGQPPTPHRPLDDVQPWRYTGNSWHPTEKDPGILRPLVAGFTNPGDLVLDPFAGAGSTLVAAAAIGRQYLGIELEEKYCEVARQRLTRLTRSDAGGASSPSIVGKEAVPAVAPAMNDFLQWMHDRSHEPITHVLSAMLEASTP